VAAPVEIAPAVAADGATRSATPTTSAAPEPAPAARPGAVGTAAPTAAASRAELVSAKEPKESTKDKRTREAREREARAATPAPAAAPATGVLRIAISPWGNVEVDGQPAGTSPPLTELTLSEGRHQIVIRNGDLPALSVVVNVTSGQPVNLRHKF
jgi:serine/threonine-protein kinase